MGDPCNPTPGAIPTETCPTTGRITQCLKPLRLSLQETLEDNSSGKGSASRAVMVGSAMTLCTALIVALAYHFIGSKDLTGIIQALVLGISGGGAGPYTLKRVAEAIRLNHSEE